MASRRKADKASKAKTKPEPKTTEAVKPSETRKVIPATALQSLLRTMFKAKNDISTMAGELGTEIKNVTNKYHFSRPILKILARLNTLPPEKLRIELEDLEHGLEASGLNDRAKDAPALPFKGDGDEDGDEGGEAQGDEKVVRGAFPAPAGVAAE